MINWNTVTDSELRSTSMGIGQNTICHHHGHHPLTPTVDPITEFPRTPGELALRGLVSSVSTRFADVIKKNFVVVHLLFEEGSLGASFADSVETNCRGNRTRCYKRGHSGRTVLDLPLDCVRFSLDCVAKSRKEHGRGTIKRGDKFIQHLELKGRYTSRSFHCFTSPYFRIV